MSVAKVRCPGCSWSSSFAARGVVAEDILVLVETDGRACRRCGARLITPARNTRFVITL